MHYYQLSIIGSPLELLTYRHKDTLEINSVVYANLQNRLKQAVIIEKTSKPQFTCKDIQKSTEYFFSDTQMALAKFISTYYVSSLGEALALINPFAKTKSARDILPLNNKITLSSEQQKAKGELNNYSQALLFGDTGSGKTEIYISLMQEAFEQNRSIIFLMPEISLTPQTKKRLVKHFGDKVALWHSKITKKRKTEILEKIANSEIKIIAGARSALFLPLSNIGLIVIDEEHDDSYKSSSRPRYNARDLALAYGKILNAKVILGSATPSVTSFKKLPTVRVKGTYFSSKKEFIFEKGLNEITPLMIELIANTLKAKKQVILFAPTRANYKYLTCKSCHEVIKCPYCSVAMSLHRYKNHLKCHYCNYTSTIPKYCPKCQGDMLRADRIGTAEIAKVLKEHFNKANIAIFDRDNITTQRKLNTLLKDFNDEKIDVLVGTQMLSKGHDYHNVTLSVILGIDNLLFQPDFKAREKSLALATQIAGRSGRKGEGKVYIQTNHKDFFANFITNYDNFLTDELPQRQNLYPPYMRLLKLQISNKNESTCINLVEKLVAKINALPLHVEIIGHGKSNIEKIANKYRYEILLRSTSSKSLIQTALTCKKPNIEIDMDPLSFS